MSISENRFEICGRFSERKMNHIKISILNKEILQHKKYRLLGEKKNPIGNNCRNRERTPPTRSPAPACGIRSRDFQIAYMPKVLLCYAYVNLRLRLSLSFSSTFHTRHPEGTAREHRISVAHSVHLY
jgi:hypothetical protein